MLEKLKNTLIVLTIFTLIPVFFIIIYFITMYCFELVTKSSTIDNIIGVILLFFSTGVFLIVGIGLINWIRNKVRDLFKMKI